MSRVLPERGKAAPTQAPKGPRTPRRPKAPQPTRGPNRGPNVSPEGTPAPRALAGNLLRTARPKQWLKNVLVFTAPGAAGVLTHSGPLERTLAAFGLFCLVASGTYFLNDALDAEADSRHPTKSRRPIASGAISPLAGASIGVAALAIGAGLSVLVNWHLAVVMGVYVAVQFGYSLYLKHQPVLDLAAVASGFVLRAIAGGVAAKVPVSEWFLIVATFGSLLMVTGKRLGEHIQLGDEAGSHRVTLDAYSTTFLRSVLAISAGGAIIGYCLWAFSLNTPHHHDPIWYQLSIVPVFVALLRYTFLVEGGEGAEPEEVVLTDRPLQVLGVLWLVLFCVGVYAS